ncbi:MAG: winged helix-turn-helix domain-containing protein [Candidatus Hadarchaeales archaeon]
MRIRHSNPEMLVKALNSPVRRKILELVKNSLLHPYKLKYALGTEYSTLHTHLRILEKAGLVGILRLGRNTLVYSKVKKVNLTLRGGRIRAWYEPAEGLDGSRILEDAVRVLYQEGKKR